MIWLFALQPDASASTGASTGATTGTSYLDIVGWYRAGAFERAVKTLASHPDAHLPSYVTRQLANGRMLLAAAAVLHLEAGHYLLQIEDERGIGHLMAARIIVDSDWWLAARTASERTGPERTAYYDGVRRDIYRGITFTLQQHQQFETLLPHLERARLQFPKDAEIRLAQGTLEELRATAIMLRQIEIPKKQNPGASWRREKRREYLDKAADRFREALSLDDGLTEARVRLGRVLQERGKPRDARRELEAAVAASPPPPTAVHYLGTLFLGEVLEDQGDAPGAIARYRETVERWPECQSAHLSLSRAFEAAGDRDAAFAALRPLWRPESDRKCFDPWWFYNDGQSWRLNGLIETLRGGVKDKS
jgi:tetratricopeptide (TPR) repeat protein